ncbi:hypothetical protein [Rhodococcus qingshengii]|uniref:hypothetical protein n=1 Tax=Rhodococcus qingshengii TaxID=334542 RepID=UPI0030CF0FEC
MVDCSRGSRSGRTSRCGVRIPPEGVFAALSSGEVSPATTHLDVYDGAHIPDEGLRHANTVDYRPEYLPEYWCIDQEDAGLEPHPIIDAVAAAAGGSGNGPAEAATTVRREFLRTTLLARKTPPKTAATYVATTLARDPGLISEYKAAESLGELLGFKGYYPAESWPSKQRRCPRLALRCCSSRR